MHTHMYIHNYTRHSGKFGRGRVENISYQAFGKKVQQMNRLLLIVLILDGFSLMNDKLLPDFSARKYCVRMYTYILHI